MHGTISLPLSRYDLYGLLLHYGDGDDGDDGGDGDDGDDGDGVMVVDVVYLPHYCRLFKIDRSQIVSLLPQL